MKTIALRDEVYDMLSRSKGKNESFSDVILRLLEGKKGRSMENLSKYAGSLKESDILDVVMEERESFRVRDLDI
ncbi:MAG: antitoxin VapB family protein [Archaeoglobaceae archaeon]